MKVLIIGGNASGMSAAFKARRENKEVEITVLEKEDYISFGGCGIPYYIGDVFDDFDKNLFSRTIEDAHKKDINLLQKHEVVSVDFDKKQVIAKDLDLKEERIFSYDKLLIATGAKPFVPNIEGMESDNIYTVTKPYMAKKLKDNINNYRSIAIVGGGFIGVEMAEQLSNYKNLKISLYHSGDELLNTVYDKEAGEAINKELQRLGVNIYFKERLGDIVVKDNKVIEIITTSRKDKVDALILAIGFKPNTDVFNDERLDKLGNGAIIIDRFGRTSIKDVWSAGDCATVYHKFIKNAYIPLATSANKIGREIGINILADENELLGGYESLGSSFLKVGKYEFASTGLTEKQADELGFDFNIASSEVINKPGYMVDGGERINFRIIYEKESYKILGARIFGREEAALRIFRLCEVISVNLIFLQ